MNIAEALQIVSKTHPGMVRAHNEDSVGAEAMCGLAVLADGMGGYNAGEVASGIAVSVMATEIAQRLQNANPVDWDPASHEELAVALLRSNTRSPELLSFSAKTTSKPTTATP